jgi:hypothetical protein
MKVQWTSMAVATLLAGAGCAVACVYVRQVLRRAAERRRTTDRQMRELAASVKALESRVAEFSRKQNASSVESITAAVEGASETALQQPKPEMLAVMTAAATAFLGKTARIRSTKLVPAAAGNVSPWSQQGRVIVQTSHNLRTRE